MHSAYSPRASSVVKKNMKYAIPFNRACFVGAERDYIARAIENGQISGNGSFTRRCQAFLESELAVKRALLVTSCTHALELAAFLLDLQPGDEVVVPSFTFVSTANAFAVRSAKIVFADVRSDTLNIDETRLSERLSKRTRAVVAVHYGGVACELDALQALLTERGIPLVEDNAHGLFGEYRGRPLGSFGRFATLSFHETKNFTCGEGGALLLNDARDTERAEILREKGTNRSRFFRGEVDRYTWVDFGSNYLLSELSAAFLWAQFEARERVLARRRALWRRYADELKDWAAELGVGLPYVPDFCRHPAHVFHLLLPTAEWRDELIVQLGEQGILAVFHYLPLHLSPMGRRYGGRPGLCPVAEDISERLVRLPLYYDLSDAEQERVIAAVRDFRGR